MIDQMRWYLGWMVFAVVCVALGGCSSSQQEPSQFSPQKNKTLNRGQRLELNSQLSQLQEQLAHLDQQLAEFQTDYDQKINQTQASIQEINRKLDQVRQSLNIGPSTLPPSLSASSTCRPSGGIMLRMSSVCRS